MWPTVGATMQFSHSPMRQMLQESLGPQRCWNKSPAAERKQTESFRANESIWNRQLQESKWHLFVCLRSPAGTGSSLRLWKCDTGSWRYLLMDVWCVFFHHREETLFVFFVSFTHCTFKWILYYVSLQIAKSDDKKIVKVFGHFF